MSETLYRYYFFVSLIMLCLGVYSYTFKLSYGIDVCAVSSSTTTRLLQNSSGGSNSSSSSSESGSPIVITTTLSTAGIAYAIGIVYLTCFACAFLFFFFMLYYSGKIPKDFTKMGRIARLFGCLVRRFVKAIVLLHYIILILLLVLIGQVGSGTGQKCTHIMPDGTPKLGEAYTQGVILILVLSFFWMLLHFGGAVVKSIMYVDSYIFEPDDATEIRVFRILLKKLGP